MTMPLSAAEITAYETAYRVLNPPSGVSERERRAVERHPFRFIQRIAAYDGQQDLAVLRFFPVQCHDISRRGISFLLPGRLEFSGLVVELGSNGEWMYFEAEAVNYRLLASHPLTDSVGLRKDRAAIGWPSHAVLIGCRFKNRLDLHRH
ncbi:MAG: hypothetical protein ACYC6Y_18260 [Thermoguttaceae bacterium]